MKEYSLNKNLILKKRKEIIATLKNGKRFSHGSIRLILLKNIGESNFKVAFLVSKKLGRKSVLRNKVKRWLREIFRHNKEIFPSNLNIILSPTINYNELSFKSLQNDFTEVVKSERFTDHISQIISEVPVSIKN